jgi:hypothetical protein
VEVSILSKGESLTSTWPNVGTGAVTVAVNQAIVAAPSVDWLCITDAHRLVEPIPAHLRCMVGYKPRVGVFTAECYKDIAAQVFPGLQIVGSDGVERIGHSKMSCTGIAAIFFAVHQFKPKMLHLHGYDLGGRNTLGEVESDARGKARWDDEKRILANVVRALRDRGCVIHLYGAFKA